MRSVNGYRSRRPPDESRVTALRDEFRLDAGESEAIVVAGVSGSPLLMGEQRGVRCARSRGLTVIRTPLIYANAKILGLIPSVTRKLDELRDVGFRLADRRYDAIFRELGE
jgi:predicted nucleic acid-binding protein